MVRVAKVSRSFRLHTDTIRDLKELSEHHGKSQTWIIDRLIRRARKRLVEQETKGK